MTSEEIERKPTLLGSAETDCWLKEIALQLARMNDLNQHAHQQHVAMLQVEIAQLKQELECRPLVLQRRTHDRPCNHVWIHGTCCLLYLAKRTPDPVR